MEPLGKILIRIGMGLAFLSLLIRVAGGHPSWALTARNGREEDGRYYLGGHGRYLEISRSRYQFCLWEEYGEIAAVYLALCGVGVLILHKKRMEKRID